MTPEQLAELKRRTFLPVKTLNDIMKAHLQAARDIIALFSHIEELEKERKQALRTVAIRAYEDGYLDAKSGSQGRPMQSSTMAALSGEASR